MARSATAAESATMPKLFSSRSQSWVGNQFFKPVRLGGRRVRSPSTQDEQAFPGCPRDRRLR